MARRKTRNGSASQAQRSGSARAARRLAALVLGASLGPGAALAEDVVIRRNQATTVFLDLLDPFGDTALVKPRVTIRPLVGPGIVAFLKPWALSNEGTIRIRGNVHSGVDLFQGGSVGNSGTIEGAGDGVYIDSCGCTPASVTNSGTITGRRGDGIDLRIGGSVTNSGNISGADAGISIRNGGGTVVNSGNVSGSTAVQLLAGGTVTNSGNLVGSGFGISTAGGAASVVNAGTIQGGTLAIQFADGDDRLTLRTGSNIVGNVLGAGGTDSIFLQGTGSEDSVFTGFENLTMEGVEWTLGGNWAVNALNVTNGILNVTGVVAGTTNVLGGTLNLSGTLGGATMVAAGSFLTGTGTAGPLTNFGTVAPGNSIGTLSVSGDFTSQPGSTFEVEVDDTGRSDRIDASGSAILNGGTVLVVPEDGATGAETDYTILTAAGGVTGTFSSLVEEFPFLDHRLTYNPSSVVLTAFRNEADFQDVAVCPNQFATGEALDAAESDPRSTADMQRVLDSLTGEGSVATARRFLDEVGAASRPDVDFVNLQSVYAFQDAITQRSANLNLDPSLPGLGFAAAGSGGAMPASGLAALVPGAVGAASAKAGNGAPAKAGNAWIRGIGLFGDRDASGCPGPGYDYDLGGGALGADYAFDDRFAAGAAFASGSSNASVTGLADNLHAVHAHGALYGAYTPGLDRDVRVHGALTAGWIDNHTARSIRTTSLARLASSKFDSFAFSTAVEASGIAATIAGVAIRPVLGLRYVQLDDDGYTESQAGALDLVVSSHGVQSLRSDLGVQLARRFHPGGGITLDPGVVALWSHEYLSVDETVGARFAGSPASSFEIVGERPERDRALLGAGVLARMNESLLLSARYLADLSGDETTQTIQAGVRVEW